MAVVASRAPAMVLVKLLQLHLPIPWLPSLVLDYHVGPEYKTKAKPSGNSRLFECTVGDGGLLAHCDVVVCPGCATDWESEVRGEAGSGVEDFEPMAQYDNDGTYYCLVCWDEVDGQDNPPKDVTAPFIRPVGRSLSVCGCIVGWQSTLC
jgi:hypothetical protein